MALGKVFVFREDFAPLEIKTVEAFAAFCKDVSIRVKRKEAVQITPVRWEAFLATH
ncbi:hypothetical protein LTR36_007345 [Oleoguttula mirabilis]|uniref:Uncharacterized protein n=1 Tax=Oleoguttula mirabilis TaxID=1507867 RepID=A0AAV9JAE1_9PEZI|nr:hypothetical protein LTR36_007345 [Oleoguttula mirabilis]